ncbi:meprin A subunit beta-like isoform X4 [Ctenopharyngodon idella]|uniref:meprin A subunit beta-like isoform X4 n=1 Tax=Ctenopharyngodon idella TaxID=7959 RepID=UPI0022326641|nr:meprin A subunit beta-like isoform X4 [Ctenopharyngodon idella]
MQLCAFLLLSLAVALCLASPMLPPDINGTEEWKDIPDINKGLNLREGDIMMPNQRSAILGNQWNIPVPYELSMNLSMNYKGVILRAFEQFRLKSCIDFKPRAAENFYISVESREGCWSYVGRTSSGGQTLSIGDGCGTKAVVEHEFLHALGFWHEQSRYDRDDYVTIKFENIIKGKESNFNKYSENVTTTQGTPYDYYSVMHYDKNAFSNGNGSTIITKRPEFQDVIGQRMDISEYDAIELNKLYKCNSSISFLDHCSFDDESLCQMSVCSAADYGWQRVKSVSGISVTDHTYLGKEQNGTSFFMHFSTEGRNEGDTARMESKTMTPKRDCSVQCLQFYYYHSGNESDQLNIWIREYQNEADNKGTLRLMDQITELPGNYWKLHHVSLNANKTFQVVFEARKGAGNSSGGFSLDDINISETECPHTWQIRNFSIMEYSIHYSPLYYSSDGYRFQAALVVYQSFLGMYVRLVSGAYDDQLQWPCPWRQITFQMLDQNPHIQKRMSSEQSITTDPTLISSNGRYYWDNPRKNGARVTIGNETVYVGLFSVYTYAIMKDDLIRREFIKGGDIIFLFNMQDISGLLQNHSLPCSKVTVKNFNISPDASARQGPCATRALPTPQSNSTTRTTRTSPTEGALPTPQSNSTTRTTRTSPTEGALPTPQSNSTTRTTRTSPTEGALPTPQSNSTTRTTRTSPTEGALPTPQSNSTTRTTRTSPTEGDCVDIFCNSSAKTASTLINLVLCFLLLVS